MTLEDLETTLLLYLEFFQAHLPEAPVASAIIEFHNAPPSHQSIRELIQNIRPNVLLDQYIRDAIYTLQDLLQEAIVEIQEFHHHTPPQKNEPQARHNENQPAHVRDNEYRGRSLERDQCPPQLDKRDLSPTRKHEERRQKNEYLSQQRNTAPGSSFWYPHNQSSSMPEQYQFRSICSDGQDEQTRPSTPTPLSWS